MQHDFIGGIVISSPEHVEMRNTIRETWGQPIKPLFIMGFKDIETFIPVSQEADIHDDIIVENFIDSYLNLTIKAAYAFRAFLKYYNGSKYFVKLDDDIFLHVNNLHNLLWRAPKDKLIGQVMIGSAVIRDVGSKWYMPEFLFPRKVYWPYLSGLAVIIPGMMIFLVVSITSAFFIFFRASCQKHLRNRLEDSISHR